MIKAALLIFASLLFLTACTATYVPDVPWYNRGDCVVSELLDLKTKLLIIDITDTSYILVDNMGVVYKTTIPFTDYERQVTECFDF